MFLLPPIVEKILGWGIFFLLLAIAVGSFWSKIAKSYLRHELQLKHGSLGYNNWLDIPAPIYMTVYMFNWTNPEDIRERDYKPNLVELGPYVFLEKHERVNVSFHPEKDSLSFDQIRTWHFQEDMSNGKLDDVITSVNVVAATTAYTLRNWNAWVNWGISVGLSRIDVKIYVRKTVKELLFDGYSDTLLTTIKRIPNLPNKPPFDKFAWFVDRNGSCYDGRFEMGAGHKDITKMGLLTHWNNVKKTKYYRDECSEVKGSTAEVWPMEMDPKEDISVFVTDLCRPLTLKYQKDYEHHGMTGSRWVGDYRVFDNGVKYKPNKCFCTGDPCPDVMSGVHNMSDCRFGAPIFASFPHFYLADKSYLDAVTGLSPDQSKHEFALTLEPSTGITLKAEARIQINTLIQKSSGFRVFGNIPEKLMIPAFWMSQTLEIDKELADKAKMAAMLPSLGTYVMFGIFGLSALLLMLGIFFTCRKSWASDKANQKITITETYTTTEPTVETTTETTGEATIEPTTESIAETTTNMTKETKEKAKPETKAETKPETKAEATTESTTEKTTEAATETTGEATIEPTAELIAETTTNMTKETKEKAKPETKAEAKAETKAEATTESTASSSAL